MLMRLLKPIGDENSDLYPRHLLRLDSSTLCSLKCYIHYSIPYMRSALYVYIKCYYALH